MIEQQEEAISKNPKVNLLPIIFEFIKITNPIGYINHVLENSAYVQRNIKQIRKSVCSF